MRIAQRIGLHRDPETLGIDPFNCEMRRRLWNQIWVLDIRSAEFAGFVTADKTLIQRIAANIL